MGWRAPGVRPQILAFANICAFGFVANVTAQFQTTINVPPNVAPETIGTNTQLNLHDGGVLPANLGLGSRRQPVVNSELNIFGGEASRISAYDGSTVNIFGGEVQDSFIAFSGSIVNISGGQIFSHTAFGGSTVNIQGGEINWINADGSSRAAVVNISAGLVRHIDATVLGTVNISGGSVDRPNFAPGSRINLSGGTFGESRLDGSVIIEGGEFRLNGVSIQGLEPIGASRLFAIENAGTDAVLSGVFADGTPFAFANDYDRLNRSITLKTVSIPSIGATSIVASDLSTMIQGVRQGQTIRVDQGAVIPEWFNAGRGSTIVIEEGGRLEKGLESIGARVHVDGGLIARDLNAFDGSEIVMSAGSVEGKVHIYDSSANVSGGTVSGRVSVKHGGAFGISGGTATRVDARQNSVMDVEGGVVGKATTGAGGTVNVSGGSLVEFVGAGGTLNLYDGSIDGSVRNRANTVVQVFGGTVNASVDVSSSSQVEVSGGIVKAPVRLSEDGRLTIVGGTLTDGLRATDRSMVSVHGGTVLGPVVVGTGTTLEVSGGHHGEMFQIDGKLHLSGGSIGRILFSIGTVDMTGGSIGCQFQMTDATLNIAGGQLCDLKVHAGSELHLTGSQFAINETAIDGLIDVGDSVARSFADWESTYPEIDQLTAVLLDESVFSMGNISLASDTVLRLTLAEPPIDCDFDASATCDVSDLDRLLRALNSNATPFDLNNDQVVDASDVQTWLSIAGNNSVGRPFLEGDSNLDGLVDATDLNAVGNHWLSTTASWALGDFTGDGHVDSLDLNRVARNWLQTSSVTAVPEPTGLHFVLSLVVFFLLDAASSCSRIRSLLESTIVQSK